MAGIELIKNSHKRTSRSCKHRDRLIYVNNIK